MKYEQKEENYTRFSRNPARIDGAIHNRAVARLGVGFDNNLGDAVDAVEIAFTAEPHGNIRSMMVIDMATAKALRDQLDAIINA